MRKVRAVKDALVEKGAIKPSMLGEKQKKNSMTLQVAVDIIRIMALPRHSILVFLSGMLVPSGCLINTTANPICLVLP